MNRRERRRIGRLLERYSRKRTGKMEAAILDRMTEWLARIGRRYSPPGDSGEDLAQDASLIFLTEMRNPCGKSNGVHWLHNLMLRVRRDLRAGKSTNWENHLDRDVGVSILDEIPDKGKDPGKVVEERDGFTRLTEGIHEQKREVLYMHYALDMSAADIAEKLGMGEARVYQLLQDGRIGIRQNLERRRRKCQREGNPERDGIPRRRSS